MTTLAQRPADRLFVVVSGLPGSGKSTLGRSLASELHLRLIDKDAILEQLFESKGVGNAGNRKALSRQSDDAFRELAERCDGAVLVSFWHLKGMAADSGTPTSWLPNLLPPVVHVHCLCSVEIDATRMHRRQRHAGHLDARRSFEDLLLSLERVSRLPVLAITPRIDVDTSAQPDVPELARRIRSVCGQS